CKTSPAYEQVMSYDTANKILVAGRNSNMYDYNFTRNSWQITAVDSAAALHDANGSLVYAPDVGLHFWYGSGIPSRIYGYNALTHQFTKLQPTGDAVSGVGMAYYDEKYKVMVVYVNRTVPNKIWVYRPPVSLPTTSYEKGNVNTSEITFKASSISGGFQTEVYLPKAEKYTLALYNVAGKMVYQLYSGSGNKGLIKNSWKNLLVAGGMYVVRLTAADRTFTRKVCSVN
ncbi:MAG: T9SS type A sorting domain-containing protein, partial [Fibrobacteres bacterium]|nr:T9SS type A sorting domain-containing protein [Fibrobacterota bacterium]